MIFIFFEEKKLKREVNSVHIKLDSRQSIIKTEIKGDFISRVLKIWLKINIKEIFNRSEMHFSRTEIKTYFIESSENLRSLLFNIGNRLILLE